MVAHLTMRVYASLLQLPLIVVLDEAYIEFAGGSRADWVLEHENLIVLRTFSKWAGLAGLRVGYGIFPHWILSHLLKIKQPYNVNVAGGAAALASLSDVSRLQENVQKIVAERGRLYAALQAFDFLKPYPSEANFILSRVIGRDAAELKATLAERGILIRYFDTPGLRNHVRISVGTPAQTSVLLEKKPYLRYRKGSNTSSTERVSGNHRTIFCSTSSRSTSGQEAPAVKTISVGAFCSVSVV